MRNELDKSNVKRSLSLSVLRLLTLLVSLGSLTSSCSNEVRNDTASTMTEDVFGASLGGGRSICKSAKDQELYKVCGSSCTVGDRLVAHKKFTPEECRKNNREIE